MRWRADFLDPRAGAVRAVTRGRVVSINVPLVQTSRFNARGSGSTTHYFIRGGRDSSLTLSVRSTRIGTESRRLSLPVASVTSARVEG